MAKKLMRHVLTAAGDDDGSAWLGGAGGAAGGLGAGTGARAGCMTVLRYYALVEWLVAHYKGAGAGAGGSEGGRGGSSGSELLGSGAAAAERLCDLPGLKASAAQLLAHADSLGQQADKAALATHLGLA